MSKTKALCYGAGTIVNAIASGGGAAFALNLKTEVELELREDWGPGRIEVYSNLGEDTIFSEFCIKKALSWCNKSCGATLKIQSNIPVAQGLSSSSALSNAIFAAAVKACDLSIDDMTIIKQAVSCSIEGGVSITGAFDDATASYLGGITVTDNLNLKLMKQENFPPDYKLIVCASHDKAYTSKVDVKKTKNIASCAQVAYEKALSGDYFTALTLNGILYASVLGFSCEPIYAMLSAGAKAAGLSGTGSAYISVVESKDAAKVADAAKEHGNVILAEPVNTCSKAKIYSPAGRNRVP